MAILTDNTIKAKHFQNKFETNEWLPSMENIPGPRYLALVESLQSDILDGILPQSYRLPTHRSLAKRIGLTVGTVSRAYMEAEKRGLTYAEVGRGTFVKAQAKVNEADPAHIKSFQAGRIIDLAILRANEAIYQNIVKTGLQQLANEPKLSKYTSYLKREGFLEHRQAACIWINTYANTCADPSNIIYTAGAQHGISASIAALSNPGDLILCEEICYTGIKGVATQLHRRRLMGVPIDEDGIIPEQLRLICQNNIVKILVCCPNHQNPTTAILSLERRLAIVEIAREFDIKIIEDDVFNYLKSGISSFIDLAPERTIYVTGMSKSLFMGIRLGMVYTKSHLLDPISTTVRTSLWTPSPLIAQLFSMWIENGEAFLMADAQALEAQTRQQIAHEILADAHLSKNKQSPHLWLNLPQEWETQAFVNAARRSNVNIVAGDLFMMTRSKIKSSAVRLSLLGPDTHNELKQGLNVIKTLLDNPDHNQQFTII
ncbi:hypothetical protein AwWohl_06330 [Gammaproteobacteria bacterium]|nr:hypothetical protein AwWohl_06330 [Gammaproteobacteria bacterium]